MSESKGTAVTNSQRLESLVRLAVKMREAQKAYFRGRFSSERLDLLRVAKGLESDFDDQVGLMVKDGDPDSNRVAQLLNQGKM